MIQLNRRAFVATAGAAASAAVCACLAGCAGGPSPEWTGPTSFDLGARTDLNEGVDSRWATTGGFFLVREGQKLYAVSSICSHKACPLTPRPAEYACPCHGSRFTRQGVVLTGPATTPLVHFGISRGPTGAILIDRTKQFSQGQWDAPGAFLTV
jgi:cytochrome b6-f complex iron-sulfur subunit